MVGVPAMLVRVQLQWRDNVRLKEIDEEATSDKHQIK
jgi:hypothetical protein